MFASITAEGIGIFLGIVVSCIAVGTTIQKGARSYITHRSAPRAQMKNELGSLKTEMTVMSQTLTVIKDALAGRDPTTMEPEPPPGMVALVLQHGKLLIEQGDLLKTQSEAIKSLQANGGNTMGTGDLTLRIARKLDVAESGASPEEVDDGPGKPDGK